jgi:pantothenate kinase
MPKHQGLSAQQWADKAWRAETEVTVLNQRLQFQKSLNAKKDLAKIQQELEKMTTLADDLSHICCEMHSELANWDPKAGEEFEKKFNEAMKR